MRMFDIISKKKYNESLSKEEIDYVINEYTNGTIPDYQMSALLMAIYFNGMNACTCRCRAGRYQEYPY